MATADRARAQGKSWTDKDGDTHTTQPSNEYGEGGTGETISGKDYRVRRIVYRDKCGRIRQIEIPPGKMITPGSQYFSPEGNECVEESDRGTGQPYYQFRKKEKDEWPPFTKDDPDHAKKLIESWKKARIPPCSEPAQRTTDHPEKPKEQPNPIGKLLQNVNIGVGVSGGHTVGGHDARKGDHHVSDHKRTTSTTSSSKKTVTAGCKCHPCTCSPCRCH